MKKTHKNVFTGILYEKFVTSLNYRKFVSEKHTKYLYERQPKDTTDEFSPHPILQTKIETRGYASIDSTNCNNEATPSV